MIFGDYIVPNMFEAKKMYQERNFPQAENTKLSGVIC